MVFIEQKPLLDHELVRHAIVVLGRNVLFIPPLLAAIMRGPLKERSCCPSDASGIRSEAGAHRGRKLADLMVRFTQASQNGHFLSPQWTEECQQVTRCPEGR